MNYFLQHNSYEAVGHGCYTVGDGKFTNCPVNDC